MSRGLGDVYKRQGRYMVYLVGRLSERPVILEFVCQKGLRLSDVGDV